MITSGQLVEGQRVRLMVNLDRNRNEDDTGVLKQVRPDAFNPEAARPWGVVFDKETGFDIETIVICAELLGGDETVLDNSVRLVDVCEMVSA